MRLATLVLLLASGATLAPEAQAQDGGSVLVFSRTEGFRHNSIPSGVAAIRALGTDNGFSVTATEDPGAFTEAGLASYDAVVFLNTTGDVLDANQQAAFEGYIQGGGGYVGVHSAADTEYDWAWYGGLVGAYFQSHPPGTATAEVKVADRVHPSTDGLPASWTRRDEWYNFRSNPRGQVHVLATLDETTYSGGTMSGDHPIAWCHAYEGGRAFYTAGGHTASSYSEPLYRDHLLGGLSWVAGWVEGNCSATVEASWEKTVLDDAVNDPMELAVAPDGRVFFVERGGAVKVYDPHDGGHTHLSAQLSVTTSYEDGLLGVTLDPDFQTNNWIYLYYSPSGGEPIQRLSRFTVAGDNVLLNTESVLLTVRTDRDQGGHSGGSITFGPDGLLYIATGDDTDPFASDGYAPIDETAGRESWDAQRTSANPFDLRGKILRIRPLADGTSEIPAGNLFPADGSQGRPEVYAMGLRNPFRISVDPERGWLYWGDVGPDAGANDPARGPRGYDEFNQAREAGFFGWPYCVADNIPYRDYDFASGASGPLFDCAAAVNDSPNLSRGPITLPAAQPAWAFYPYAPSPEFPDIPHGSGRTAMAGPIVSATTPGGAALPAYFDGSVFVYEWSRNWIIETHLDDAGQPLAFQRFLPGMELNRPIDMELGPDGALYFVEWGTGFGGGNPDATLSRLSYAAGSRAPVARVAASVTSGTAPLAVSFTSAGTFQPDGFTLDYAWDFDGDGTTDATTPEAAFTYTENGSYSARLTVTDANGLSATATVAIVVGNSLPLVSVTQPLSGGFYAWGDSLRFSVSVSDPEDGSTDDGSIDCSALLVQPGIGHDDHNHPLEQYRACSGTFQTPSGHGDGGDNVFLVLDASYTDNGASGVGALTGRQQVVLRPKTLEAENYTSQSGVQIETTGDYAGGENIGYIGHGDWVAFEPINLEGIRFVTFRVASAGNGGTIEARMGDTDGPLLASARVSVTGDWQTYKDITVPVAASGETGTLYLVFKNTPGTSSLFNINWIRFHGDGVAIPDDVTEGLRAEYFDNPDLSGPPTAERIDPQVSFDWGAGAPIEGVPTDGFSVRWTGTIQVPERGRYVLRTVADDGARLWIDDELTIDAWDGSGLREQSAGRTLEAGEVSIRMEYRDNTGLAEAALLWRGPGIPLQTLGEYWLTAEPGGATGTESPEAPALDLDAPRPNPARGTTEIGFRLETSGETTVELFDALGRRVLLLHEGPLAAGPHALSADVSAFPSGVYLVRLSAGGEVRTRSLTLVR